mgnify:CR=1 FL=1
MSAKISKNLAKKIVVRDEPLTQERETAIMAADVRSKAQNDLIEIDENLLSTLQDVFADTGLMNDRERLQTLVTQRKIIYRNFVRSGHAALAMGNALLDLEASLTADERERLKQSAERILPFGDTVASMLRSVARFVQAGKVPENDLPASYSAAYVLTSMTDPELAAAREGGLIRPEVGRRKLLNFRSEYRARVVAHENTNSVIDIEKLQAKRDRLQTKRRKIAMEYFRLSDEVREIARIIGAVRRP